VGASVWVEIGVAYKARVQVDIWAIISKMATNRTTIARIIGNLLNFGGQIVGK
jgi:hypothetical protein